MKVVLYMAITANGYIAREDDSTNFVSEIEWNSFRKIIKKTKNLIIGRRTYEIMKKNNEFSKLSKIKVIVISSKPLSDNNITFVKSAVDALELLNNQGFKEALIAGGSQINSLFMKEKLIDEIYLDIEPIMFGKGIKLFHEGDFESSLELIGIKKLSKNEIQLHYKVIK